MLQWKLKCFIIIIIIIKKIFLVNYNNPDYLYLYIWRAKYAKFLNMLIMAKNILVENRFM